MPRMVLGILLTRANTPVLVDVLVDALWAGQRDPRAAKKLQLHVHRLWRVLDTPARIRFEHGGYALQVHPGELDAERVESALTDSADTGHSAHAVALLRKALRLWRGNPFSDITDLPLLRAEADRLAEHRLAGLAQLYAVELACGHANSIDITDFTGRNDHLATVQHLAAATDRSATVLIAVTGKAGVGKTTLAVHAAHRLRAHYPDGQLFVDLCGAQGHPLTPAGRASPVLAGARGGPHGDP